MISESGLIMSIPQIRLCLTVLGFDQWDDLPLTETNESAEQRLMNAFLDLTRMGRMIPEQGKYRMNMELQQVFCLIGNAKNVYCLYNDGLIVAFLYENDEGIIVISPDRGNPEHCRIYYFKEVSAEKVQDELAALYDIVADAQLREAEITELGQYQMDKLVLFLNAPKTTGEAK